MTTRYLSQLFSPSVKAVQRDMESRSAYARADVVPASPDVLSSREMMFIASRDSFYMATVGQSGWPYIQHRGGPVGFVKIIDERTLGFADYRGNRQYISTGNLADDSRVSLFLMDYPRKARLKLLGRARVVASNSDANLVASLGDADYGATVERGVIISVDAFDWNCPQHITPRFTLAEIEPSVAALKARIAELEAQVTQLRSSG